ncbi:MAG: CocE/NonD family hydrolase [Fimbriimonadaceae bacterium]
MIALLALVVASLGMHAELNFTLAGAVIGKNTYDEAPDGSFKSHSELTLGPQHVISDLSATWKHGVPENLLFTQNSGASSLKIAITGGKVVTDVNGVHHQLPYTFKGKLFFTNFHPQLARYFADVYRTDIGGKQKLKVFFVEAQQPLDIDVTSIPSRNARRGNTSEVAEGFTLDLPGVALNLYTVGDKRVDAIDAPSQQFQAVDVDVTGLLTDPIAAFPELSQATFKIKAVNGVKVPMRDGVELVHDALMPEAKGKFPVILVRTPYGRKGQVPLGAFYAARGYVYIVQDVRGREDSDGVWDPMVNERKDGFDTIQWIAKQPWCDGNVGMIGGSYGGYVQWAAAVEHPKALKCIVPQVSPPDAFTNIPYEYGTLPLVADTWWLNVVRNKQTDLAAIGVLAPKPQGFLTLPLADVPKAAFGYELPMFTAWLKRDRAADWKGYDIEKDIASVKIPVLNISGWWDGDGIGTELHWTKLEALHKTNQWLIEGPWTHAFNTTTKFGEYDFGPGAIRDLDSVYLRWFDTWLKGKRVNLDKMPKASVFMTGENRWHDAPSFPEPAAKVVEWYLGSAGKLGARPGAGSSKYTYDPHDAVMPKLPEPFSTSVSLKLGAAETTHGAVEFKSKPFDADTSFEGSMTFKAFVRTDVVDTDLYVIVADVFPDGTTLAMASPGKLRLAYRNGFAKPELMKPGHVYGVTIHPWWFAHRFPKGHRLAVIVRSSLFPGTARNLNTGEPLATATRMVIAHVEVMHDKLHPSSLTWYRLP